MVVWKPFQETLHLVSLVPKQKINFRIHEGRGGGGNDVFIKWFLVPIPPLYTPVGQFHFHLEKVGSLCRVQQGCIQNSTCL